MKDSPEHLIKACFSPIVGQERIVYHLDRAALAYAYGGELSSVLFEGEAGLGKTALWNAYLDALNVAWAIRSKKDPEKIEQSKRYSSPHEFRRVSEDSDNEYTELVGAIYTMRPLFLGIDEMADFKVRPTVQTEKVYAFIKKALDENGYRSQGNGARYKNIRLGDSGDFVSVSKSNFAVIGATNFPEKMPDADAMRSRFERLVLDQLSVDNLTHILLAMLKAKGISANEQTISMVAKTGRGTARPLEKIVKHFDNLIRAKQKATRTINRAEALQSLKALQLYPKGLTPQEVRLLKRCCVGEGYRVPSLALMLGLEVRAVTKSIAFLQSFDFLGFKGSNIVTASKGIRYLAEIKKDGFYIPE